MTVGQINPDGPPINASALPLATTQSPGAVELATSGDVDKALKEGITDIEETDSVLTTLALPTIADWVGKEIGRLESRYSVLYVDGGITRRRESDGAWRADPATIPDFIWDDIKTERGLHQVNSWSGTAPADGTEAFAFCRQLIFPNLNDLFDYLANRTVENQNLYIYFYRSSELRNSVSYAGLGTIWMQPGPSAPGLDSFGRTQPIDLKSHRIVFSAASRLYLIDLHIVAGSTSNRTKQSILISVQDASSDGRDKFRQLQVCQNK